LVAIALANLSDNRVRDTTWMMKIALVHYTSWPVIGGVESVIRQHAQLMSQHGHTVEIFCGKGRFFNDTIPTQIFRELNSQEALVRSAQDESYHGPPGQAFFRVLES